MYTFYFTLEIHALKKKKYYDLYYQYSKHKLLSKHDSTKTGLVPRM